MTLDRAFVAANYVEAGLWAALGVAVLVKARGTPRLWLSGALVLFGISDLIEIRTGAWYRPLGLVVLKCACVLVLVIAGVCVWRRGRRV